MSEAFCGETTGTVPILILQNSWNLSKSLTNPLTPTSTQRVLARETALYSQIFGPAAYATWQHAAWRHATLAANDRQLATGTRRGGCTGDTGTFQDYGSQNHWFSWKMKTFLVFSKEGIPKSWDTHREYQSCWREDLPTWAMTLSDTASWSQMLTATRPDQHWVAQMIIENHWFAAVHFLSVFSVLYNSSNLWTAPMCPSTAFKLAQATAQTTTDRFF